MGGSDHDWWYTFAGSGGAAVVSPQAAFVPGSRTIVAPLYETTGGVFDQATNPAPNTAQVDTATITFAGCSSAQLQYTFNAGSSSGKSGVIALTRVGPVPAGCGP